MKTKRKNRLAVLPKLLVESIESLNLTDKQLNNAIILCELISNNQSKKDLLPSEFVDLPQSYLKEVFKSVKSYNLVLQKLKAANIIEVESFVDQTTGEVIKEYYSRENNKSKAYRINLDLIKGDYIKINTTRIDDRSSSINNNISNSNLSINNTLSNKNLLSTLLSRICIPFYKDYANKKLSKTRIRECMGQLYIDKKGIKSLIKKELNNITIDCFDTNEKIKYKNRVPVVFGFGSKVYMMPTNKALSKAKESNKMLIQDKKVFRIMDGDVFIKEKRLFIESSYMKSLLKFDRKNFYFERNSTNTRLDTNLTNLCSTITKKIMEDNNLISIDLNNSQFAILCWVLQTELATEDYIRFKRLSASGELYDYLKEKFSLSSRKEAKTRCFELLFSSYRNNNEEVSSLKQEFPNVVTWVNDYKKKYGDKKFSVLLQSVEAYMFIDILYKVILDKVMLCLTKHDSFIIKREDQEIVTNIIKDFFQSIEMDCMLEIEDGDNKTKIEVKPSAPEVVEEVMEQEFDINFGVSNLEDVKKEERFVEENWGDIFPHINDGNKLMDMIKENQLNKERFVNELKIKIRQRKIEKGIL